MKEMTNVGVVWRKRGRPASSNFRRWFKDGSVVSVLHDGDGVESGFTTLKTVAYLGRRSNDIEWIGLQSLEQDPQPGRKEYFPTLKIFEIRLRIDYIT